MKNFFFNKINKKNINYKNLYIYIYINIYIYQNIKRKQSHQIRKTRQL